MKNCKISAIDDVQRTYQSRCQAL